MSEDEKDHLHTTPIDTVEDGFVDDDDEEKDKDVLSQESIGMSEDRTARMTFPLPETRYKRILLFFITSPTPKSFQRSKRAEVKYRRRPISN